MWRTDSFEKTLMLGKLEGRRKRHDREWDGWMASPTQWTWVWVNSGNWRWTGRPGMLLSMGSQRVRHNWATQLNWIYHSFFFWKHCFPYQGWFVEITFISTNSIQSIPTTNSRKNDASFPLSYPVQPSPVNFNWAKSSQSFNWGWTSRCVNWAKIFPASFSEDNTDTSSWNLSFKGNWLL